MTSKGHVRDTTCAAIKAKHIHSAPTAPSKASSATLLRIANTTAIAPNAPTRDSYAHIFFLLSSRGSARGTNS
jgi:hypothetical protein